MLEDFIAFRRMITPIILKIIFWLAVAACVTLGIGQLARGRPDGLFILFIAPLICRIACELILITFGIYDELVAIRKALTAPPEDR